MRRFEPMDGERVLVKETIHWKNYLIPGTVIAACLAFLLWRLSHPGWTLLTKLPPEFMTVPQGLPKTLLAVEATLLLLICMASFFRMMGVFYTQYYLTTKRIVSISGIVNRSFKEILLDRVEMVDLKQSAYERLYDCGDILLLSAGAQLVLDDVRNALEFKQSIMTYIANRN